MSNNTTIPNTDILYLRRCKKLDSCPVTFASFFDSVKKSGREKKASQKSKIN